MYGVNQRTEQQQSSESPKRKALEVHRLWFQTPNEGKISLKESSFCV